jgi:hypothetical protein
VRPEEPPAEHTWIARKVRPVVALYVAGVFGVFMVLAHFVFHSPEAVKALFLAAMAGEASLAPSLLSRLEYRITEGGIARRPLSKEKPREFQDVLSWSHLSHMTPTRTGFKYFRTVPGTDPRLLRFLKLNVLGDHSGEIYVEPEDRERVRALLEGRCVLVPAGSAPASRSD